MRPFSTFERLPSALQALAVVCQTVAIRESTNDRSGGHNLLQALYDHPRYNSADFQSLPRHKPLVPIRIRPRLWASFKSLKFRLVVFSIPTPLPTILFPTTS
jgi:hypothetical protein